MTNYFGWQPSLLLSDMCRGGEAGAMNIHMNQAMADLQARSTLYMTPVMNWNCFTPYGNMPGASMNYLLDPNYTIGQYMWNQTNNQNSIWGGGFGMPSMNWNNPFQWNNNPSNPSNPSAKNKEDKSYQIKYQKLEKIVKQLTSKNSPLTSDRKDELTSTLNAREGQDYKAKYENLLEAYNEIPKDEIKEFLASDAADGLSINSEDAKKNSFYKNLLSVGYDFEGTEADDEILPLYNAITAIKDDHAVITDNNILGSSAFNADAYNILDVLSSWNNVHKDENIIDLFAKQYKDMKDESSKSDAIASVVTPIVTALTSKASKLVKELDSTSQATLKKSIDEVKDAAKGNDIDFDKLSKAFNKLYLQTRLASLDIMRAEIKDYYGSIDEEVFGDTTLFEADTIEDLKVREGFSDSEINAAKLKAKVSKDVVKSKRYDDKTKSAQDKIDDLVGDGYLKKATKQTGITGDVWYDVNTGKVYIKGQNSDGEDEIQIVKGVTAKNGEVTVTGEPDTEKVEAKDIAKESEKVKEENEKKAKAEDYINNNPTNEEITVGGKKYAMHPLATQIDDVVGYVKKEDGLLYAVTEKNGKYEISSQPTSASDAETKTSSAFIQAEKMTKYELTDEEIEEANKIGAAMQDALIGYTQEGNWTTFRANMNKINSTNVLQVLQGFNRQATGVFWNDSKFFAQLEGEDTDTTLKEEYKTEIIKYLNEYIDDNINNPGIDKDKVNKIKDKLTIKSSANVLDVAVDDLINIFKINPKTNSKETETGMLMGVGMTAGAAVGFKCGAAIGSIGGPAGTVAGGLAGAVIGGVAVPLGRWIYSWF